MRWNFSDVGFLYCIFTRDCHDMEKCGSVLSNCSTDNNGGDMLCNATLNSLLSRKIIHETTFSEKQVPETPMWLLSKNRPDDALKSLQWLRGWVPAKNVEKEFAEMQRYSVYSSSCASCQKTKSVCEHPPPTFRQKLQELTRKRNLRPFILALICFGFTHLFGLG